MSVFHLACNVHCLTEAREFYGQLLGCEEGRSTETWIDFNFFGHQLSLHLGQPFQIERTGHVGDKKVPMPHFGAVLPMQEWEVLAQRLITAGVKFELEPQIRFKGQVGEQSTMFFYDPSGNPIEMKGFKDFDEVFAK